MTTFLTPRRWQKQLQRGSLKRNAPVVKPAVWFLQWMKIQEIHDQESDKRFRKHAIGTLR
ncbi:MAG: hypothetical protein HOO67_08040 [Candidatus Peribacteraceae bacterium]|nr:hypothetical protein [Candidatus Peribacteraceae bacterium]